MWRLGTNVCGVKTVLSSVIPDDVRFLIDGFFELAVHQVINLFGHRADEHVLLDCAVAEVHRMYTGCIVFAYAELRDRRRRAEAPSVKILSSRCKDSEPSVVSAHSELAEPMLTGHQTGDEFEIRVILLFVHQYCRFLSCLRNNNQSRQLGRVNITHPSSVQIASA